MIPGIVRHEASQRENGVIDIPIVVKTQCLIVAVYGIIMNRGCSSDYVDAIVIVMNEIAGDCRRACSHSNAGGIIVALCVIKNEIAGYDRTGGIRG